MHWTNSYWAPKLCWAPCWALRIHNRMKQTKTPTHGANKWLQVVWSLFKDKVTMEPRRKLWSDFSALSCALCLSWVRHWNTRIDTTELWSEPTLRQLSNHVGGNQEKPPVPNLLLLCHDLVPKVLPLEEDFPTSVPWNLVTQNAYLKKKKKVFSGQNNLVNTLALEDSQWTGILNRICMTSIGFGFKIWASVFQITCLSLHSSILQVTRYLSFMDSSFPKLLRNPGNLLSP